MYNNTLQKPRKLFGSRRSKIKMIALSFTVLGLVFGGYVLVSVLNNKPKNVVDFSYNPQKNTFSNFSYRTTDNSGKEIEIHAEKVIEENKESFIFKNVNANFMLSSNEKGNITSGVGKMSRGEKPTCEFSENVHLSTESGLFMQTKRAFYDSATECLSGNSKISIEKDDVRLSGNSYNFDTGKNVLILTKRAKAHSNNQDVFANKIVVAFDSNQKDSVKKFEAQGNATIIAPRYNLSAADSIIYEAQKLKATRGVVLLYRKDNGRTFTVQSDKMEAVMDEKSEIIQAIADGSVLIRTADCIIKANQGIYNAVTKKIVTSGSVVVSRKQGNVFGEEAELDLNTENVSMKKSSAILFDK